MSSRPVGAVADASSLGLRAFHVVVFLGFAGGTVAGMWPELRQLVAALSHRWHFGTMPSPLGTAAALVAIGLSLALIVQLVRGRSAPLWMSVVMLVTFAVSIWQQSYVFSRRSAPGANLVMLDVGKALHEKMRVRLQEFGAVPNTLAQWEEALSAIVLAQPELASAYRTRSFSPAQWNLRTLAKEGDFLLDATPGTFTVFIPADASRFTITMVGLDPEHQTVRLRDDHGQPFELKGAFTPDTRQQK